MIPKQILLVSTNYVNYGIKDFEQKKLFGQRPFKNRMHNEKFFSAKIMKL
jgi:hypothetical protein